jgi:hypothetical protein
MFIKVCQEILSCLQCGFCVNYLISVIISWSLPFALERMWQSCYFDNLLCTNPEVLLHTVFDNDLSSTPTFLFNRTSSYITKIHRRINRLNLDTMKKRKTKGYTIKTQLFDIRYFKNSANFEWKSIEINLNRAPLEHTNCKT